jgi:hypothetical protein
VKYIIFASLLLFSGLASSEQTIDEVINSFVETEETQINTGVQGKTFEAKKLSVELNNINDAGFLLVIDPNGQVTIADSAEQTLGMSGSSSTELEPFLKEGSNVLIFALWNKEGKSLDLKYWEKTFLSGYSYKYSLIADGTTLYKLEGDKSGKAGVAYWNAFFIVKNGDNLTIEPLNKKDQNYFKRAFEKVSNNTALTSTDQKAVNLGANIAHALQH